MGAIITGFKLGAYGMILMTADQGYERLKRLPIVPYLWRSIEIWHPAFKVNWLGRQAQAGFSSLASPMRCCKCGRHFAINWQMGVTRCASRSTVPHRTKRCSSIVF
jgi:hypothetical protein